MNVFVITYRAGGDFCLVSETTTAEFGAPFTAFGNVIPIPLERLGRFYGVLRDFRAREITTIQLTQTGLAFILRSRYPNAERDLRRCPAVRRFLLPLPKGWRLCRIFGHPQPQVVPIAAYH